MTNTAERHSIFKPWIIWLGVGLALSGLIAFLILTPGDLLRKADYIAAAVCHRRPSHSFETAGHQHPLCQRCTGTFPGAFVGLLIHWLLWKRRRAGRFPRTWVLLLALACAALWGFDGLNSTSSDSQFYELTASLRQRPEGVGLLGYAPQPWLRLLSGTLMGMSMSLILVPAFNQTAWLDLQDSDEDSSRTLQSWREVVQIVAIEVALAGILFLLTGRNSTVALYVIALLDTVSVFTMFTMLGAMMFMLVTRHDLSMTSWKQTWPALIWGVVFTWMIVGGMDIMRLSMTGTIDSVPGIP